MKKLFFSIALLLAFGGCKKNQPDPNSYPCLTGCDWRPPTFYFLLTDSHGASLFSDVTNEISVSYWDKGQLTMSSSPIHPYKTLPGASTSFLAGPALANLSENGIKTFYLTYLGKTDTLGLDIHAVTPITANNGGHSTPIVTFNGRPMQSVPGGTDTPDYFVLKRR